MCARVRPSLAVAGFAMAMFSGCGGEPAPRVGAPSRSVVDQGRAERVVVRAPSDPSTGFHAAPMVETVGSLRTGAAGPLEGSVAERRPVDREPPALRVAGFDTDSFRASLTSMRAALDEEQRRRFDRSVLALVSATMQGSERKDPAGPVGSLLDGLARLEGRSATELFAMAESVEGNDAVPRKNANESAAIATLKNISSAQAQCQASGVIDTDGDGAGEFGSFGELSGAMPIRGSHGVTRITPPVLSAAFGNVKDGVVVRSGYVFRMFLPQTPQGLCVAEAPDGGSDRLGVDSDLSEVVWRAYAWPTEAGKTGSRAFFVDQSGDVLACSNARNWSGPGFGPDANAALLPGEAWQSAANEVGCGGDHWVVVR